MRVYVETNFVLELVLLQAESQVCEQILELAEGGKVEMIIPAFSIVEPYWKVFNNRSKRNLFREELQKDKKQLSRTTGYQKEIKQIEDIDSILSRVIDEEQKRFAAVRERILTLADLIPWTIRFCPDAASFSLISDSTRIQSYVRQSCHFRNSPDAIKPVF